MPGWQTGPEASDLGRFEPSAYDLGITDDPDSAGSAAYQDRLEPAAYELYGACDEWFAGTENVRPEAEMEIEP